MHAADKPVPEELGELIVQTYEPPREPGQRHVVIIVAAGDTEEDAWKAVTFGCAHYDGTRDDYDLRAEDGTLDEMDPDVRQLVEGRDATFTVDPSYLNTVQIRNIRQGDEVEGVNEALRAQYERAGGGGQDKKSRAQRRQAARQELAAKRRRRMIREAGATNPN